MFNKLREKLKNWAKNLSKETEKEEKKLEVTKEEPKKHKTRLQKIETPLKFDSAKQKYEPDLEKIQEIEKELEIKGEIEKAEEKEEETERPGFFERVKSKISKVKISEKAFEIYEEELKMLLLENNVAFEVADKIISRLKEEIIGKEFLKKEIEFEIKDLLKQIIQEILVDPINLIEKIKEKQEKPYIILFCGINGTGKTTTIAKIAYHLKKNNLSSVLAASDTFRAASIEQIKKHAEKLNLKVISHDYGTDPASVGFDTINYAKKNRIDAVLIDTAGRMHTEKNLLREIEKIARVCKPDLKLFIGEAITGNDSVEQVKSFDWAIGIDGIILTKADTDEKGGTALSVGYVTKKPILYLGTGQEYDDIIVFDKKKFIEELGL